MNPPMIRTPEPGDASLPEIYDSPLSQEEREERINKVADEQAKIVAREVENTPGSFSYLTPEYRRDRAKSELDTYSAALDSIIAKAPDSEVAQIAEIIKGDLDTHFKKKLAILNQAMEKTKAVESNEVATKKEILTETSENRQKSRFVGKEIRRPEIQKMIAHSLDQIESKQEDGEDTVSDDEVERLKGEFVSELQEALVEHLPSENVTGTGKPGVKMEAASTVLEKELQEFRDKFEATLRARVMLSRHANLKGDLRELYTKSEPELYTLFKNAKLEKDEIKKNELSAKIKSLIDAYVAKVGELESSVKEPSAVQQELLALRNIFDASENIRIGIANTPKTWDTLKVLFSDKEPQIHNLFEGANKTKDENEKARLLEEIKVLVDTYTKAVEGLKTIQSEEIKSLDLPVASPESLRTIPRWFEKDQIFFLPAEGESTRANWKIISRNKALLELEQIDGTPIGRKIMLHAKDLQELLKDIDKERDAFEKSELEKDREKWQKALAEKGVLRPKGEPDSKHDHAPFAVGQTVHLLYKGSFVEWSIKEIVQGVRGKVLTLESGDQQIFLRQSTLRRRLEETERFEGEGEPRPVEDEGEEGERFYLGRSITIPDGEHQGVWHILSREDAGATLQKFGSDETFKINYEDLEKIIADYEALHPEAASGPDAKPEKISNPPVGQLISLFSQSRSDPRALYQGYLTWERNWITNHAIDNLREKRGNIAISDLQIENTKKVLGIYKKMLRLKAEGKNISIEGAEGSMLLMARILAGKHHDKFSDIKYLVESYRPETDAALIEKLERRIADAEQGVAEGETTEEGRRAEKRAPQTIEEWVPVIRSDFDGLVAKNEKFKEKLNDDDANELTDQENLVDGLIDRLEAIFAEVADREARKEVLRKEIAEAWARDEDPKEENDELDTLLRLGSDVPKEAQTLSNEIYAAIQQYMQITKQKSKLIEAREKLQKSFQSRTAETPQAFAERDKARFDAEAGREKRVKKLLEEQHELMSGAKQAEGELWSDGMKKLGDYLDLYTERREVPGTNEVSYYLKSFGKDDPRTDIIHKMLKNENDVLYVLMDTKRYPDNEGKEIKLFFKETAPEEKYPTAKELFTENYSPAKELGVERTKPQPQKKKEQPDTRTEAEKAAIGKIHTGDVPYETSPYTAGMVRPVYEQVKKLTAEQKQERAKTVGATLDTLWKKYALGKDGLAWWKILAPLAVMSAVAGSGNEGGERSAAVESPAVATTLSKPWRSELSPEIEAYARNLSTKSISQIAAESVLSSDPNYVKNLLSAPAGPILYDNTAANPEGTLDADRIDHRKEASAILKQGESLARSIRQYLQKIQADPNLIQEAAHLSEVLEKEKRTPREDEKEGRVTVGKYLDAVRALVLKTQS